ncbi:MAG: DUF262 domain-containing protein [Chitinophaga sp.]|uniref:DUF262 domain-containing protein n=1 Tax=Chitinophaga sp. TaxID=1869181 RepID=UPI0025BF928B|nr:DUF262 domain-containing protein [Chitinophaga sp.]MBV8254307.1 DUF262 domain-containing protein [Chitinophaga sp.]
MSHFSIRDLIHKISKGLIRIPSFQRGFVWDADSVAFLFDTIYKGLPFGTVWLWRTREQLITERELGPFKLLDRDPDYPIDYVLDGQQRLTSLFCVFQNELITYKSTGNTFNIYFDITANAVPQESQFYALNQDDVDENRHFPLNCLFDTIKYRTATERLPIEIRLKIDELQAIFKEVQIPYQSLETDDRTKVALAFERMNRIGVPLDIFQLLSAWTWSDDFALQSIFNDLATELEPFGFEEVGVNINLLLRITAAVLVKDATPSRLMSIRGEMIKERFPEVVNGIRGAIDFLQMNLNVACLKNLPYENLLVPLSVFFSSQGSKSFQSTDSQRITIEKWFWRTCFSRRYSAGGLKPLNRDIIEIIKLKNQEISNLAAISCNIGIEYFQDTLFQMGNINTSTFILLLVQQAPRSLISGNMISLREVLKEYNRNEFHHIYPRAYLKAYPDDIPFHENCLANFCILSQSDNKQIGGNKPSIYRRKLGENIEERCQSALIDEQLLVSDDYKKFIEDRSRKLLNATDSLINLNLINDVEVQAGRNL